MNIIQRYNSFSLRNKVFLIMAIYQGFQMSFQDKLRSPHPFMGGSMSPKVNQRIK